MQRLIQKDKFLKEMAGKTFCQSLINLAVGAVSEDDSLKADLRDSTKFSFDFRTPDDSDSENEVFQSGSMKVSEISTATFHQDQPPMHPIHITNVYWVHWWLVLH